MKTIAVIRLGRLGDVTLTGPTIKNLRFLYPDASIVFVTREMYRPLAKMLPGVDDVIAFPDDGNYFDLVELSSRIDEFNPDLMVDLHKNSHQSALQGRLSQAPQGTPGGRQSKEIRFSGAAYHRPVQRRHR